MKKPAEMFARLCIVVIVLSVPACGDAFIDKRAVKIGSQTWAAKNLDVTHFRNGDLIPEAKTDEEWIKAGQEGRPAWCYYNNDPENGEKYGKLYNWFAVNDPGGLAPEGWHIPGDEEWLQLTDYLGGEEIAGLTMKSSEGWHKDGNGNNDSGFNGLPGGSRSINGLFLGTRLYGFWWSSTETYYTNAKYRFLENYLDLVGNRSHNKGYGFSVRCVKD